jgi:hypothetical protein
LAYEFTVFPVQLTLVLLLQRLPKLLRINAGQRQPRLMLPPGNMRLQTPFAWQIRDAAQVTVVEKDVSIVAWPTGEYFAVGAIGQFDGGA